MMLRSLWNTKPYRREDRSAVHSDELFIDRGGERRVNAMQEHQHFIHALSNSLRDPMGSLVGVASSLTQTPAATSVEEVQDQIQFLLHCSEKIEHLLDYAQRYVEVEKLIARTQEEVVDEGSIIQAEVAAANLQAAQRGIKIRSEIAEPRWNGCLDPQKLCASMRMLIGLAVYVSPDQSIVKVSTCRVEDGDDEWLEIRVKDRAGIIQAGDIDASDELSLFHFDLEMIRRLVHSMGGLLVIDTDPEFTTEYIIRLREHANRAWLPGAEAPSTPDNPSVRNDTSAEELSAYLDGVKAAVNIEREVEDQEIVLIVEDSADFRFYLRSCLEGDYQVIEARHGKEGLALAKEFVPDLIISDVMMPYMDGHTLCRHLKEDEALNHIPVILSTALAASEYQVQGLEAGADSYLVKPFDSTILMAVVKNILDNRHRLRRHYSNKVLVEPTNVIVPAMDEQFLDKVKGLVESYIADPTFNLGVFADEMIMSERQLQRKFKTMLGMTPMECVRIMRMKRAAQLLEQRAGNISEIAYQVGFKSARHFTSSFRKFHGMSPTEYMEQ